MRNNMEMEEFCDKYCPVPFRGKFRNGDDEVDCDLEQEDCPFKDVDFTKVKEYDYNAKG
jgi:hypothetical protein